MTDKQFTSTHETQENDKPSLVARWIEDPFASVMGGVILILIYLECLKNWTPG